LKDANVKQRYAELGAETVAQDQATPEALRGISKLKLRSGPIIKKAGVYAD